MAYPTLKTFTQFISNQDFHLARLPRQESQIKNNFEHNLSPNQGHSVIQLDW